MVEESELLVAEASFPSTGLGIELQVAQTRGIPVVLCFREFSTNKSVAIVYETPDHQQHSLQIGDGYVSLMALGMPTVFRVIRYRDNTDGVRQVMDVAKLLVQGE
jgi:hypothetical protein